MNRVSSITVAIAAAGLAAASAGHAAQNAAAPPSAASSPAPPKKDPGEKLICKDGPSSSRIPGPRVCHTKSEWDQMSRNAGQYDRSSAPAYSGGMMYGPH